MAEKTIYPHGGFEQLSEGVWRVRGGLPFPMHRNMIVIRLANGELLLHSVVALDAAGMAALEALGKPAYMIVPSVGHQLDSEFYRSRYAGIRVLAAAAIRDAVRGGISATVEDVLPGLGFTLHPVPGAKASEIVYEWPLPAGGRMLMTNDLFAGPGSYDDRKFMSRIMQPLLGTRGGQFGIARIVRMAVVADPAVVSAFVRNLAAIADLRLVTVSHGEPLRERCAETLRAVAA